MATRTIGRIPPPTSEEVERLTAGWIAPAPSAESTAAAKVRVQANDLIDRPGVYDIPFDVYLADPVKGGSLSHSGSRKLMPPHCPAYFDYCREHPSEPTDAMEEGRAVHSLLLGGPEVVPVDFDSWRGKEAQRQRGDIRAAGQIPVLAKDMADLEGMVAALRRHPEASVLLDPARGKAEQTLVWQDKQTGVWRRSRVDFLPDSTPERRMLLPDYKTTRSASPVKLPRAIEDYGYHTQGGWYLDGVEALGLAIAPVFMLIFQEKTPPYLITVVEVPMRTVHIGRIHNRWALEAYAWCTEHDTWPGYEYEGPGRLEEIRQIGLPPYVEAQYESEFRR